jgi:hypothetical protein
MKAYQYSAVPLLFVLVSYSQISFAKSSECSGIVEQLRQMKSAQTSVQQSLVANHEILAQSLESYADALSDSAGRAHKAISDNMVKASESIRKRGLKAQSISKKLETNTDDLIKSVEKCLK